MPVAAAARPIRTAAARAAQSVAPPVVLRVVLQAARPVERPAAPASAARSAAARVAPARAAWARAAWALAASVVQVASALVWLAWHLRPMRYRARTPVRTRRV